MIELPSGDRVTPEDVVGVTWQPRTRGYDYAVLVWFRGGGKFLASTWPDQRTAEKEVGVVADVIDAELRRRCEERLRPFVELKE